MAVRFHNHQRLYQRRKPEIDAAIARVIASGRFDWGDEVPAFEAEFAAWNGASHAVGVNSGSAALKVALLALGIGPGDEVITVGNTDIASSSAIHNTGARPVWVDTDAESKTMALDGLVAAITPKTRAILPVDLYGHPADMVAIVAIARQHNLVVVEDACLALGARINGQKIGSFADITCFSFAPSKHLGSFGSGGAALTESAELAETMRKLSAYGQDRSRHYAMHGPGGMGGLHHETHGLNERLDEMQAAILRAKLPDLAAMLADRRAQADRYDNGLSGLGIDLPGTMPGYQHAWRNYVIEAEDRDGLAARLAERGIATNLTYAPPMHLQPVFADYNLGPGTLPATEHSARRLLGLPIGPQLTLDEIDEVIAAVRTVA
ncbi:dTDP-4-amino-4,6-dideoxygalactose transaminase [Devosia sp. YR412]|uniref:DegT/DnrJ/EryC1/StrS family aminotransferase n=1 Tax=Devosia sp. YR412 TaxID=1881030 RepID=UPI0008ADD764|nr:DegT/DnrJ/EryC1/StrS family aminotransferase [Devosia sp. YR412]SEQ40988.1 dTDP-4-amino-4,6-dideoxygalactose transaminase [Devosia sp. YR412]